MSYDNTGVFTGVKEVPAVAMVIEPSLSLCQCARDLRRVGVILVVNLLLWERGRCRHRSDGVMRK